MFSLITVSILYLLSVNLINVDGFLFSMSGEWTQKVDVLDLLINLIKEHEEKLDELVTRLENL